MGSASERLRQRDQHVRLLLVISGLCWTGLAIANLMVSMAVRWYPDIVAAFAVLTALFTFALVVRPRWALAYRVGGSLGIGTLILRLVSVVEGMAVGLPRDLVWLSLAACCITTLLIGTYWRWWLQDIKVWHETHKWADRSR